MENPELTKEREFLEFKARWDQLFTGDETQAVREQVTSLPRNEYQAYFRASSSSKERHLTPKVTSWSLDFGDVDFYLNHRISSRLKNYSHRAGIDATGDREPVVRIVNKKFVPQDAIKKGLEGYERIIDESKIPQENILTMNKVGQLEALKRLLLEGLETNSIQYSNIHEILSELITTLNGIYELKAKKEAESLGYGDKESDAK